MSEMGHQRRFDLGRSLPVYPDKQTSSDPVGMSQTCQKQKFTPTVRTACYAPSVHVSAAGTSPSWHNPYKD
jgi:hypothetical protein